MKLRTINLIIKISLVVLACVFTATLIANGNFVGSRISAAAFSFIFPFALDIMRLFKIKLPERFELAYLIFLFFAQFLGIDFDFYKFIPLFDKVIHGVSGILTFVFGLLIADACGLKARKYINARIVFAILLSIAIALFWETIEFTADSLFGMHMQTLISAGPADTMLDMIWAAGGATVAGLVEWRMGRGSKKPRTKQRS